MTKTMKITVTLSIDLDPEAWAEYQGLTDKSARSIRADVRGHVLNHVQGSAFLAEAEASISLKTGAGA